LLGRYRRLAPMQRTCGLARSLYYS